jgi:hypothetical protein
MNVEKVSRYDGITVSEKTAAGMTLTIDDRKFIKVCLDVSDSQTEEYVIKALDLRDKIMFAAIKEFIIEENSKIHVRLDALDSRIERIENRLDEYDRRIVKLEMNEKTVFSLEDRITKIEKHTTPVWDTIRILIGGSIIAAITMVGHRLGLW